MKTALTIAGSDSCGGAGIQADLKAFSVLGVYGMSVLTAITAQNTLGVSGAVELEPAFIGQQIEAVASDIRVDACKTGMLSSVAIVEAVAVEIARWRLEPYVCDPVMFAKSGAKLLRDEAIDAVKEKLFPLAAIVTPNRREAAMLAGIEVDALNSIASAKEAAARILSLGAKAAVIKGIAVQDQMVDVFYDGADFVELASKRFEERRSHGSGCTFSAAIAAGLAQGLALVAAVDQAKRVVIRAIEDAVPHGRGTHPVNVLAFGRA